MASLPMIAQVDVTVKKSDFMKEKEGFSEAWKHVQKGNSYFSDAGVWYGAAFDEYTQALIYNNENPELNYKAGVSALMSDRREEAAAFLLKSIELKPDVTEDVKYMAARALKYEDKYSEALTMFNDFISSAGKKSSENVKAAQKYIEECNSALSVTKDIINVSIENAGAGINSSDDEYSEVISPDGRTIYFASRRQQKGSAKRNKDTRYDENIFMSVHDSAGWSPAILAGKDITTKFCEAPLYITPEANRMYLYAGYENDGDIKVSTNRKGKWRTPEKLAFPVNSGATETSFCIAPSGEEIYFVSESPKGNLGGRDIYYSKKLNKRKWSKPINAGTIINTPYDEESVRFSAGGDTLWFSSKGHNSIGGYDIFYSVKNAAGEWDSVKNIGCPVNTPWDEVFFNPVPSEGNAFYFASNRKGGMGGLDIYKVKILPSSIGLVNSAPDESIVSDVPEGNNQNATSVIKQEEPVQQNNEEQVQVIPVPEL